MDTISCSLLLLPSFSLFRAGFSAESSNFLRFVVGVKEHSLPDHADEEASFSRDVEVALSWSTSESLSFSDFIGKLLSAEDILMSLFRSVQCVKKPSLADDLSSILLSDECCRTGNHYTKGIIYLDVHLSSLSFNRRLFHEHGFRIFLVLENCGLDMVITSQCLMQIWLAPFLNYNFHKLSGAFGTHINVQLTRDIIYIC